MLKIVHVKSDIDNLVLTCEHEVLNISETTTLFIKKSNTQNKWLPCSHCFIINCAVNRFYWLSLPQKTLGKKWNPYSCVIIITNEDYWVNIIRYHCVKRVRIRSYSGPHFPRIFPHSDWIRRDTVSLRIQSECGKIRGKCAPE